MSENDEKSQLCLFTEETALAQYGPDFPWGIVSSTEVVSTFEIKENETEKPGYFITGLDLCNEVTEPEEEDLVESLIVKGALSSIVGTSGVGKSTLARQIAFAIANQEESVLGFKINTSCHDVIYCSTEDSKNQWKKRMKVYNSDGSKDASLLRTHLLFGSDPEHFIALESLLKALRIALVIVDVFSDIFTGDPNNNIHVRGFLKKYKNLAFKYDTSFLLVHHIGKKTENSAPTKNSILGSQGFESSMRSVFELRADQYHTGKIHLCILKQNYLSDDIKSKSYVLNLKDDLSFEFTGERIDLAFLAKTNQRVAADADLTAQVLSLHRAGLASRDISQSLKEQGISIGRTRVCEIIREDRGNVTDVLQTPIVDFDDYRLGEESLN